MFDVILDLSLKFFVSLARFWGIIEWRRNSAELRASHLLIILQFTTGNLKIAQLWPGLTNRVVKYHFMRRPVRGWTGGGWRGLHTSHWILFIRSIRVLRIVIVNTKFNNTSLHDYCFQSKLCKDNKIYSKIINIACYVCNYGAIKTFHVLAGWCIAQIMPKITQIAINNIRTLQEQSTRSNLKKVISQRLGIHLTK